ncbi:hypothetical protein GCM10010123_16590 [Pilimelia anulata]|uniref:Ricin B lectin domain-containing protein n=1 Tax=Pilimelia anulata TaxID=53371 RepID=A0A8J3B213_9ACTN|nr:ricin-type beta-trefoil lectin domain protein [Pilimelia anulata]GGJ87691.1 hypothetical protein GCM10010123_16590 [Pilimelia anulata]
MDRGAAMTDRAPGGAGPEPAGADRGSMPLAMLLALVAMALTAAALPAALTRAGHTRLTVDRGAALRSAQTGLEVALARVRSMTTYGELCGSSPSASPVTFAASTGANRYTVVAQFYATAGSRAPGTGDAATACAPGSTWMRLTATGTGTGGASRTLSGLYPLHAGGGEVAPYTPAEDVYAHPRLILAFNPVGAPPTDALCMEARGSVPPAGTPVTMQPCPMDFRERLGVGYEQFWYYRSDLTLATVGSLRTPNASGAMCLDAGADAPPAGTVPTMRPCVTPVPPRQKWYYNNFRNYELGTAANTLSGRCLNVADPGTPGSGLVIATGGNCRVRALNTRQHFAPFPYVGPGVAGMRTAACPERPAHPCELAQLRNAVAPGYCAAAIDDSNNIYVRQEVPDETFMFPSECFQNPSVADTDWSQLFRLPATPTGTGASEPGPIYTVKGTTRLCLEPNARRLVQPLRCDGSAEQQWVRYGDTGDYDTEYRITHPATGRCLTIPGTEEAQRDPSFHDFQAHWYSYTGPQKMGVLPCRTEDRPADDDESVALPSLVQLQKWNSPGMVVRGGEEGGGTPPAEPVPAGPLRDLLPDGPR